MTKSEKILQFLKDAFDKQLQLNGYTEATHQVLYEGNLEWTKRFIATKETEEQFKQWFFTEAKKRFKWPKRSIEKEFGWYLLQYGLTRRDYK